MLTIKPALAQTTGSVLKCQIPVPDPGRSGMYIAADGTTVAANTPGAFPPAMRPFTGEQVKRALRGNPLPGTTYQQSQAYLNYIRRLQGGPERLHLLCLAPDAGALTPPAMTTRYAAPPAGACLRHDAEGLTLLYHRPSGQTHILIEPAPDILDALADVPKSEAELLAALAIRFDVSQTELIGERLAELVAAGLVSAA